MKEERMDDERTENELSEAELDEIAGGGTYTKDGFLKTTYNYRCEHFECKTCGFKGQGRGTWGGDGYHACRAREYYSGSGQCGNSSQCHCGNCKWHTTLKCNNPLNKR